MITDMIINALLAVPYGLLKGLSSVLPDINFKLPEDAFNGIMQFLRTAAYILPIKSLLVWLLFSIVLDNFRIIWAFILRVKSFIPTMGR